MRGNPEVVKAMGLRLKQLRQATGLSQDALAVAAHVPLGTLRNWEQGRVLPQFDAAYRLAKALGITLDELAGKVFEEGPPTRKGKRGKGRKKGKPA